MYLSKHVRITSAIFSRYAWFKCKGYFDSITWFEDPFLCAASQQSDNP